MVLKPTYAATLRTCRSVSWVPACSNLKESTFLRQRASWTFALDLKDRRLPLAALLPPYRNAFRWRCVPARRLFLQTPANALLGRRRL